MNDTQKLLAFEEIKQLMARRVRCLDTKDWDGFRDCYAKDGVSYSLTASGTSGTHGNQNIADGVKNALAGITTVHHVHIPEIELIDDDNAKAIWPLNDTLSWEEDGKRFYRHGFAHYRQTYKKEDGRWVISEHHLSYLLVESGSEDVHPPILPPRSR